MTIEDERKQAKRDASKRHYDAHLEEQRERIRSWKRQNPEKAAASSKQWGQKYPARKILTQCRGNAKQRGLECGLTLQMIEEMLQPMVCSATGLPLSFERVEGQKHSRNPWYPSIDRLDNSAGYVQGNTRVVCSIYNFMRSNHSDQDVLAVARALVARHG